MKLLRQNLNGGIILFGRGRILRFKRLAVYIFILSLFLPMLNPAMSWAGNNDSFDELALQAVRNNYEFYRQGQDVNGQWGYFGAYDAYILARAGAQLDSWIYEGEDFASRVIELMDLSIDNGQSSAKGIAAEVLAAGELGEDSRASELLQILQTRQAATGNGSFDSNAFSDIPALEMLGRAGLINEIDSAAAVIYILEERDDSSGAWTGSYNDIMVTAQAIRTLVYLEPYVQGQSDSISAAVNSGLQWLKARQKEDGSFLDDGGWDDPVVDTAEAIYTLNLLNIDPETWKSDSGCSPADYLAEGAMSSEGVFGSYPNIAANTWVLDACLQLGGEADSQAVLGIEVSPANAAIKKGETKQFTAESYTLAGGREDVTAQLIWSAEDESVVSIDSGLATGLAVGATDITARCGSISGLARLTVERDSSGGGSGGSSGDDRVKVYIAVAGRSGELLFSPQAVYVDPEGSHGLTAVGALDATGLSWSYTPGLVTEIEGQSNQGMNGWMCKINDTPLAISAFESQVKQNDQVIWWYSFDPYSNGPDWNDLSSGSITVAAAAVASPLTQAEEDIISLYLEQLEELRDKTIVINAEKRMSAEQAELRQKELDKNLVSLKQEIQEDEMLVSDELEEIIVYIPNQAIASRTTLSIQEAEDGSGLRQYGVELVSSVYNLGPDGTRFLQPLTICIETGIGLDLDLNRLSPAWYDSQKKQWITIPGLIDVENGRVLFRIDHFTAFTVAEFPPRQIFADVSADMEWAREAIEVLAGQGIVRGTGSGFEPSRPISRAEFVQLMVKALNLSGTSGSDMEFADVQFGDWFAAAVNIGCANNIISGYPDGTFRPGQEITRNEAASILRRLQADRDPSGMAVSFADKGEIPSWALPGISFSYQAKLMNGYEDGTFRGNNSITRAEAALTVYRYLNYLLAEEQS